MKKLKILNIILEARLGGPQLRIAQIAADLKKKHAIETVVIMPAKQSDDFKNILAQNDTPFHTLPLHKLSKNFIQIFKWMFLFIPEIFSIWKIIKKEKPHIVYCNGCWQWKPVIAARLAKKKIGVKIVWHLNDTYTRPIIKFMFNHLISIARRNGIAGFTAEVLQENRRMQNIFNHSDFKVKSSVEEGVYSYVIDF